MKKTLLLLYILSLAFSSCKKCYTCTTTDTCGYCVQNGVHSATYCKKDGQPMYDAAESACGLSGGTWVTTNAAPTSSSFCIKSNDKTGINNAQNNCQAAGGVWSAD